MRHSVLRTDSAVLSTLALVFMAASPSGAADAVAVMALRVNLAERASTVEFRRPAFGSFRLDIAGDFSGPEEPESFGIAAGIVALDVALRRGRFSGTVDGPGGVTRASVRARGGRLRATVKGTIVDGAGGAFGLAYLRGCADTYFWDGVVYGMHPVAVRLGAAEVQGVLGIVGRSAWPARPKWDYGDWDENEIASVRLTGTTVFPGLPDPGPSLRMVPEERGVPWTGRVRGCALLGRSVPLVSVSGGSGAGRLLDPLNAEALDFGPGQAVSPGVQVLEAAGLPVYQVLFDSAVPEALSTGEWCVVAEGRAGSRTARRRRVQAPGPTPLLDFDLDDHALEIWEDGTIRGWGANYDGQLGNGSERGPLGLVRPRFPGRATAVAAGYGFSLALDEEGRVWQWGAMRVGDPWDEELGRSVDRTIYSTIPWPVEGLPRVRSVAGGDNHALALDQAGRVWAWGENREGQLGDGTLEDRAGHPVLVDGLRGVTRIAAGDGFSLALDTEGRVWAWGDFRQRQSEEPTIPTTIDGIPRARDVSAKGVALVLGVDGSVWAWGANGDGEVGDGTTVRREDPVRVVGLDRIVGIDAGDFHAVALREDGTVWAWGYNSHGQLGDGTSLDRSVPVQARDMTGIVAVRAAAFMTVALGSSGDVWGWGSADSLPAGAVGSRRGVTGIYPQLLPRTEDGRHIRW